MELGPTLAFVDVSFSPPNCTITVAETITEFQIWMLTFHLPLNLFGAPQRVMQRS